MPNRFPGRRAAAAVTLGLAATIVLGACDDSGDDAQRARSTTTSRVTTTSQPGVTTTTSSTVPPFTPAPVDSCGDQLEFIVAAINDAKSTGLIQGGGDFTPQRCKLSQSELIWAVIDLVPNPGSSFTETRALMERLGGRWTVHQLGTTNLGCDAPERARVELEITCDNG